MSRALVVASDGNPIKLNFWARNFFRYAQNEVDKVYITLGTCNPVSPQVYNSLKGICDQYKFKLVFPQFMNLAQQYDFAVHLVNEDYVGLTEDDVWLINSGVYNDRFNKIESKQYNMVASCYYDPKNITKENFDKFGQLLETQTPADILRPHYLWSGWLFMKSDEFRNCIHNYLETLSHYAICDGESAHPKDDVKYPHKLYQNIIPSIKFWSGVHHAGIKMPTIHPDWVFTKDTDDEILFIASIALIRHANFNVFYEQNRTLHPSIINYYFDVENFTHKPKWDGWTDWIHCGGLGGHKGIFDEIKNTDGYPLIHAPMRRYNQIQEKSMGLTRHAGNLAIIKSWNRPELQDLVHDYSLGMDRIIPQQEHAITHYVANQLTEYLV